MKRYPGVIALGGFISGVSSFILVDRQQGMASWIAVIMLVSWLWLMLENSFTQLFTKLFKREIPEPLLRYATQMIHQESLFFVLPFFFITTTWNSGQSIFTGLLGAAALVSITDPLYYKWLAPKRSLFLALHTLTLFAALLTALPIILHLTTAESYKLALGVAMVAVDPEPGREPAAAQRQGLGDAAGVTAAIGCAGLVPTQLGTAGHPVDDRSGHQHPVARPHTRRRPQRGQRRPTAQRRAVCLYRDQRPARAG